MASASKSPGQDGGPCFPCSCLVGQSWSLDPTWRVDPRDFGLAWEQKEQGASSVGGVAEQGERALCTGHGIRTAQEAGRVGRGCPVFQVSALASSREATDHSSTPSSRCRRCPSRTSFSPERWECRAARGGCISGNLGLASEGRSCLVHPRGAAQTHLTHTRSGSFQHASTVRPGAEIL